MGISDSNAAGPVCRAGPAQPLDPNRDGTPRNPDEGRESPIILALDEGRYALTSVSDGVQFDIRNDGRPVQIAWTSSVSNVLLAMDRDRNGSIDDGAELFGNHTPLLSGSTASHGFEALAELDDNVDGVIDALDPAWANLLLWADMDHDGVSAPRELQPITASDVTAIGTTPVLVGRKDRFGNVL